MYVDLVTNAPVTRNIDDGNATVTLDVRYLKPDPSVIEVVVSVRDRESGSPHPDTEGDNEYRQNFTGSGPGGKTELAFYLYPA